MKIEIINGVVLNDGEEIGFIEESVCTLRKPVGPTVKGAIKRESVITDLSFAVSKTPGLDRAAQAARKAQELEAARKAQELEEHPLVAVSSASSLAAMSDDELAAEMKRRGLIVDVQQHIQQHGAKESFLPDIVQPPVIERDLSAVDRLHKLAAEGKIPRPPEKHPAMGDKDPAYVAWFKAHATPAEIATRYPENRRVPASVREFQVAAEKLQGKLLGEKKDTDKANDFADVKEGAE